jgi:hypothetical protein
MLSPITNPLRLIFTTCRLLGAAPSAFRGCGFRLNLTETTTTTPLWSYRDTITQNVKALDAKEE